MTTLHQFFKQTIQWVFFCCAGFIPLACNIFEDDGSSTTSIVQSGYFYLIDKAAVKLVMLDSQLREVKRWDILPVTQDSSLQGITFDGKYLWISSSGNSDQIYQVDASEDTLVVIKSFNAPPQQRGTIRDITWDGFYLWVVNSGSLTYSVAPTLYKLNPSSGEVISEYPLPSHDPRGLTYVYAYGDIYGRTADAGICYTDVTSRMVYKFNREFAQFDTLFSVPTPPRGRDYRLPVGLTYDGINYWLVNGSTSTTADHLYKLSNTGKELSRFDLTYESPGPIVYTTVDVRTPAPPAVLAVSPNSGVRGTAMNVDIFGAGFKAGNGLTVSFGDDIRVDSVLFISPSQLRSSITIDTNASEGKRSITVTNPGGRSATGDSLFEVTLVPLIPHLWLVEQDMDTLYQIRASDTTVVQAWDTRIIAASGSPQGLAYDGTNIWLCASGTDRRLYQLNTSGATLSAISSIPGPTSQGTLRGMVWDNGSIWIAVSTVGRIYRVDPATGSVLDSVNTPGAEPRGIAFAEGQLYCNDTSIDSVFVYDTFNKSWKSVFATPTPPGGSTSNRFATGMAWDGNNFWIANSTTTFDHVFKVTRVGVVLQYFQSPRLGPAQITGIVYTPN